jgi:hypothetical protein
MDQQDALTPQRARPDGSWMPAWVGVLTMALAVIPVGRCPACWPAYLSIVSALGLGSLASQGLLSHVVLLLLVLALVPLMFYVRKHQVWTAGAGALIGASLVLTARNLGGEHPGLAVAGALVITASAVHAVRNRRRPAPPQLIQIGPRCVDKMRNEKLSK